MDLYRRIAAIRTQEDASDLVDELMDRYGDPPQSVYTLLDVDDGFATLEVVNARWISI